MKIFKKTVFIISLFIVLCNVSQPQSRETELRSLKDEVESLRNEITEIRSLLDRMTKDTSQPGRSNGFNNDSPKENTYSKGLTNEANYANVAKTVKTGDINMESYAISLDRNSAWPGLYLNLLGKPNAPVVIGDGDGHGKIYLNPNGDSSFYNGLIVRQKGTAINFLENAPLKVSSMTDGISAEFVYQKIDASKPDRKLNQHLILALDPIQKLAKFYSDGSSSGGFYFGADDQTEYMRITSKDGNVGINNSNPQEKLDIIGSAKVRGGLLVDNEINADSIVAKRKITSENVHAINFNSAQINNRGNIINSNGNIKSDSMTTNQIGVNQYLEINSRLVNPLRIFTHREHNFIHVDRESDTNNGHQIFNISLADNDVRFHFGGIDQNNKAYYGGYHFGSNDHLLMNINPSTNKVRMQVHGGDFEITGSIRARGTISSVRTAIYSDQRSKTEIEPIQTPLKKIRELKPKSYKSTIPSNEKFAHETQFGLIAQDVEKVLPNLVHTNDDGYKSVDYIGLIPLLVEAVKEQQNQIEELEKKIK